MSRQDIVPHLDGWPEVVQGATAWAVGQVEDCLYLVRENCSVYELLLAKFEERGIRRARRTESGRRRFSATAVSRSKYIGSLWWAEGRNLTNAAFRAI